MVREIIYAVPDASFVTLLPAGHKAGDLLTKAQILTFLRAMDHENKVLGEVIELTQALDLPPQQVARVVPRLCLSKAALHGLLKGRDIVTMSA